MSLEAWGALVVGLIGTVLTFRASRKKDAVSEQSGAASNHRAANTQVIEGYQGLLAEIRKGVAEAEKRCEERIADAVADLTRELVILKEDVDRRPTKKELLDDNGKLRKQLLDLGETPINGT